MNTVTIKNEMLTHLTPKIGRVNLKITLKYAHFIKINLQNSEFQQFH